MSYFLSYELLVMSWAALCIQILRFALDDNLYG